VSALVAIFLHDVGIKCVVVIYCGCLQPLFIHSFI